MKICTIVDCGLQVQAKGLCKKHYMRQWYKDHPEGLERARVRMSKVPSAVMRDRHWRYAYGVDTAWYDAQFLKQNGVCAICHKPENKTIKGVILRLAVDHCHERRISASCTVGSITPATLNATLSCRSKTSSNEPSKRSAQRCAPVAASINCAVMRTLLPPLRTLPSRT